MSQSLVQIYVHLVFSTKSRVPFLRDPSIRKNVHAYLEGICRNQGAPSLQTGGAADHVHILCRLSKTLDVSTLIRELKRDSSKWIKTENPRLDDFHWQRLFTQGGAVAAESRFGLPWAVECNAFGVMRG